MTLTAQKILDAERDVDDLGAIVNGDANTDVVTRYGGSTPSIRKRLAGYSEVGGALAGAIAARDAAGVSSTQAGTARTGAQTAQAGAELAREQTQDLAASVTASRVASETARNGAQAAEAGTLAALAGTTISSATLNAASRTVLAALDTTSGLPAFLTEVDLQGLFIWDGGNLSGQVTSDPAKALYVPPTGANGSTGAWVRRFDGKLRLDWFRTALDANDSAALKRAGDVIQAQGGGTLVLTTRKIYIVGGQTFQDPSLTGYSGEPVQLFTVSLLTRPLIIEGNGATIRCGAGFKFGTFNSAGVNPNHPMPYTGTDRATPYKYMLNISGCTALVRIDDLELDGNIRSQIIGGQWGDTGWQIPMTGLLTTNNSGGIMLNNVKGYLHGQDGWTQNGVANTDFAKLENVVTNECKWDFNGRLGIAIVGGRGITLNGGSTNWNASNDAGTPGGPLPVTSNPGAGVDLEAEAGKFIRDVILNGVEQVGNKSTAIVADGTNVSRITVNSPVMIQVNPGSYVLWPNCDKFKVNGGLIAGTIVFARGSAADPGNAFLAIGTTFTTSSNVSPTGVIGTINNHIFESAGRLARAENCHFIFDQAGVPPTGIGRAHNCKFTMMQGGVSLYGTTFSGETRMITNSDNGPGSIYNLPEEFVGNYDAGGALDNWIERQAGVEVIHLATLDRATGKAILRAGPGGPEFIPQVPSMTSATINIAMTGVAIGDIVAEVTPTIALGGMIVFPSIEIAGQVRLTLFNPTGAAIALPFGSWRLKVIKT